MTLITTTTTTLRPTPSSGNLRNQNTLPQRKLQSQHSTSNLAKAASSPSPPRRGLAKTPRRLPGTPATETSGIHTASTPNLGSLYRAHLQPHDYTPASTRLATLGLVRKGSVAALTSGSLASIPDDSETYAQSQMMPPLTPSRLSTEPVTVGDLVDVPGNMYGWVRFIGSVAGRKGVFAGVELHPDHASRGKNSGDVDGACYFTTAIPGSGIFLPLSKAVRREPALSPVTPTASLAGLKPDHHVAGLTPPTPSIPKFSQSVGPTRAPSPQGKQTRTSLSRPDSPVRRLQLTPASRPSLATPAGKPGPKFGSPNASKFGRSLHGTTIDPPKMRARLDPRAAGIGPRSASALGSITPIPFDHDPVRSPVRSQTPARTKNNGSTGSSTSMTMRLRPPSRTANIVNEEEIERLRSQLDDRDHQLKEQAATLAEMESSLTELQTLIEHPDGPHMRRNSLEDKDASQLRALLREKNEKIAMLTAEFDAHRADFRSTIDTLEMASTETERVYEKRLEELIAENKELQDRSADVNSVARQLKQLEELVQELEEGLEDARRGEAEARGEVEFLRGEVERTRAELRREREKAASVALKGNSGNVSKELEQKEDEIRGLKAIIHSLSRDSIPDDSPDSGVGMQVDHESIDSRTAREKLEREVSELQSTVNNKIKREEELEREIETLRRQSISNNRVSAVTVRSQDRSSIRDSKGTVILAPETHKRGNTLDTMPESDAYSTATENSTLWCEICETAGHDILTCSNMFGSGAQSKTDKSSHKLSAGQDIKPAPLSPIKTRTPDVTPTVKIVPNPMESGPVAGKESGVIDADKWCAICERDGHDSVDCPFEDAF